CVHRCSFLAQHHRVPCNFLACIVALSLLSLIEFHANSLRAPLVFPCSASSSSMQLPCVHRCSFLAQPPRVPCNFLACIVALSLLSIIDFHATSLRASLLFPCSASSSSMQLPCVHRCSFHAQRFNVRFLAAYSLFLSTSCHIPCLPN